MAFDEIAEIIRTEAEAERIVNEAREEATKIRINAETKLQTQIEETVIKQAEVREHRLSETVHTAEIIAMARKLERDLAEELLIRSSEQHQAEAIQWLVERIVK